MIADAVRVLRTPHWMVFFGLVLASWAVLLAMSVPADLRASGRVFGAEFLAELCLITPDAAGFARVSAMWALMGIAMMAPTALPAFATYEDLSHVAPTQFWRLVAGFVTVWAGFALVVAAAQMALFDAGLLSPFGELRSTTLSALVLIGAGVYQFSPMKAGCLAKCRAPMTFFIAHWDEGPWRNGLRLGLVCLACCWALMCLAFVGGGMSVAFMALATVIMVTEKLPSIGEVVTRPLGWLLIGTGLLVGVVGPLAA